MKQRTFPILAVLLLAAALSGCQSTAAGDSAGLSIHFIDPGRPAPPCSCAADRPCSLTAAAPSGAARWPVT